VKFALRGDTLSVSEIGELAAATAGSFQSELAAVMSAEIRNIDLDLSQTAFVDCGGLGALVSLRKSASNGHRALTMRLLNAPQSLQQMVSLMKMESVFPILASPLPENSNLAIQPATVGALTSSRSRASLQ
jgi:anti-anti-sigma factor